MKLKTIEQFYESICESKKFLMDDLVDYIKNNPLDEDCVDPKKDNEEEEE